MHLMPLISICLCNFFAEGQHTLTKTIVTSKVGKLAMFTKKRSTCIGCKAVLDDDGEDDMPWTVLIEIRKLCCSGNSMHVLLAHLLSVEDRACGKCEEQQSLFLSTSKWENLCAWESRAWRIGFWQIFFYIFKPWICSCNINTSPGDVLMSIQIKT